jgi:hypothetical protein
MNFRAIREATAEAASAAVWYDGLCTKKARVINT